MSKRKALSGKNAPRSFRLGTLALIWLIADRIGPGPIWWGVIYTVMTILFLLFVTDFFTADEVEL